MSDSERNRDRQTELKEAGGREKKDAQNINQALIFIKTAYGYGPKPTKPTPGIKADPHVVSVVMITWVVRTVNTSW